MRLTRDSYTPYKAHQASALPVRTHLGEGGRTPGTHRCYDVPSACLVPLSVLSQACSAATSVTVWFAGPSFYIAARASLHDFVLMLNRSVQERDGTSVGARELAGPPQHVCFAMAAEKNLCAVLKSVGDLQLVGRHASSTLCK